MSDSIPKHNLFCDVFAGSVAGAGGVIIGYPFDSIKTWQQNYGTSIFKSCYEIIRQTNSMKEFYRGASIPILTAGLVQSVLFAVYGTSVRLLEQADGLKSENERERLKSNIFKAGCIAGVAHSFILCPIELIKIKMQTNTYDGSSIGCIGYVIKRRGFSGLFRGIIPTLCRDVIPYGIYMVSYESVCRLAENGGSMDRDNIHNSRSARIGIASAGAIAGLLSWLFVFPFDVIKTTMQAETTMQRKNMRETVQDLYANGGYRSFFRGVTMIMIRAVPVNAISFLILESTWNICNHKMKAIFPPPTHY